MSLHSLDGVKLFLRERPEHQVVADYNAWLDQLPSMIESVAIELHRNDGPSKRVSFSGCRAGPMSVIESNGDVRRNISINEYRMRRLSATCPMYTDIKIETTAGAFDKHSQEIVRDCYIGLVPVMTGSKLDPNVYKYEGPEDDRVEEGFFIINGRERVLISQRRHIVNTPIIYSNAAGHWAVLCKSSDKSRGIKSTSVKWAPGDTLQVIWPMLAESIDIGSLFRVLGHRHSLPSDIVTQFKIDDMGKSMRPRDNFFTSVAASDVEVTLLRYLLPHTTNKGHYLELMVMELYWGWKTNTTTNRDSLFNQIVEGPCALLTGLFRHLLIKWRKTIRKSMYRSPKMDIGKIVSRNTTLWDGLRYALSTGLFSRVYDDSCVFTGVSQILNRVSRDVMIAQMRQVSTQVDKTTKAAEIRHLNQSHIGRFCAYMTPEGASCGLERQITFAARISVNYDSKIINDIIQPFIVGGADWVIIDGHIVSAAARGDKIVQTLRRVRRQLQIAYDVSIYRKDRFVYVHTTGGRILRPLFVGKQRPPTLPTTLREAIGAGLIEFLDIHEENLSDEPHCEIHSALLFSHVIGCIPDQDKNTSPKMTFTTAMEKQVYRGIAPNRRRLDTNDPILWYAQHPLVYTIMGKHSATGFNPIVAVFPGATEDGIIFNQRSIDFGMGRCSCIKTMVEHVAATDVITKVVAPGDYVRKDDPILVRERVVHRFRSRGKRSTPVTSSASLKAKCAGRVHEVLFCEAADGTTTVNIKIRMDKIPTIGDKFASRFAQKGVISRIVAPMDMPFTAGGMTPDIIFNMCSIPSRMTLGHVVESQCGKLSAIRGRRMDRTSSTLGTPTVDDIIEEMRAVGFDYKGTEIMFDGKTGRKLKVPIFIGSNYYRRLVHDAAAKLWGRARGRRNAGNKQPNTGRAQGGAFRVGEMEKDALQMHGVSSILRDRLLLNSDAYETSVCEDCGCFHIVKRRCLACKSPRIKTITVPYPFFMFINELFSININVKIKF